MVAGACGLAVGTPIALLATNGKLSRRGIIVKGGLQVENLSNTSTIVFDKTDTLTTGNPFVSDVVSFDPRIDPTKILEYAAIAEKNVNHPIAKAIVTKAQEMQRKVKFDDNSSINNSTIIDRSDTHSADSNEESMIKVGRGIAISYKGRRIAVGNMKFMKAETESFGSNIDKDSSLDSRQGFSLLLNKTQFQYLTNTSLNVESLRDFTPSDVMFSSTTVFVSLDRQIIGAALLEDKLRPETVEAIAQIRAMNVRVVMLTGDNERTANKIAKESGIAEYHADLLPEDKVSIIEKKGIKNKEELL